jgi:membrane-bound lytic murein transglycosylase D
MAFYKKPLVLLLIVFLSTFLVSKKGYADDTPLPLLPGLEEAVEFWRLVFTRYRGSEVIFHDTLEPMKIYKVQEVGENNVSRRVIDEEIEKIMKEHGLGADEKRIRAQRGIKERFASGLRLSRRYLGRMQQIFEEEEIPVELAYLPLVESAFDIRARSRAGALGLWQFMPSTGKRFLRIGPTLDERRDPLESTRAAARFLKQNYQIFGNWPLALTAYNHGRDGMLRAMNEVGSNDLVEIIRHYQGRRFGFASKSFYAEFLAAVDVAKKSEEFFPSLQYHPPLLLEEMELDRAVSVTWLLKPTNVSTSEFLEWNPALRPNIREMPKGYRVKVPPEKLEQFVAAYQRLSEISFVERSVRTVPVSNISWIRHRVTAGETLSQIARNYQTSVPAIRKANKLRSSNLIAAGQHLKIPKR